jgi:ubiquinone biosynthesis protein
MLFVDRYFHADPHPGNFLVEKLEGGGFRVVVLDFGAICEAREDLIDGLLECVQGVFTEDDATTLRGFFKMGFVSEGGNRELIEKTARTYFDKLLKIKDRTPAALMKQRPEDLQKLADPEVERKELQDLMRSVEYPEDWFYVERACVMMFWLCAQIDPNLDTMTAGFPYVMPLVMAKQAARAQAGGGPGRRVGREGPPETATLRAQPGRLALSSGRNGAYDRSRSAMMSAIVAAISSKRAGVSRANVSWSGPSGAAARSRGASRSSPASAP